MNQFNQGAEQQTSNTTMTKGVGRAAGYSFARELQADELKCVSGGGGHDIVMSGAAPGAL
jgi:hypothetical protein